MVVRFRVYNNSKIALKLQLHELIFFNKKIDQKFYLYLTEIKEILI